MSVSASETTSAYFGIGRRKTSVAKVILVPGTGSMVVNQKPGELYMQCNSQYINTSKNPLITLGLVDQFDINIKTKGGGFTGQTDAICLAIARALANEGSTNRSELKNEGLNNNKLMLTIKNLKDAKIFANSFKVRGYDPIINEVNLGDKGVWYRVSLGAFDTLVDAKNYVISDEEVFTDVDHVFIQFE